MDLYVVVFTEHARFPERPEFQWVAVADSSTGKESLRGLKCSSLQGAAGGLLELVPMTAAPTAGYVQAIYVHPHHVLCAMRTSQEQPPGFRP